jgi:hypothetical protein
LKVTDQGGGAAQRSVGVVSLTDPGWEHRLRRFRGAIVTDVALLSPGDVERLAAVWKSSGLPVVPDLPEAHDPASTRLARVLSEGTSAHLVLGVGRCKGADVGRRALRDLALAQITALNPLVVGRQARIGPSRVSPEAFVCSFELGEVVVELSAVLSQAGPEAIEITVLEEGLLTRLLLPIGAAEWPSEISETTEGARLAMPARYSSGRREAWLCLYRALEEEGADNTPALLAHLSASLALLERLGLPP